MFLLVDQHGNPVSFHANEEEAKEEKKKNVGHQIIKIKVDH